MRHVSRWGRRRDEPSLAGVVHRHTRRRRHAHRGHLHRHPLGHDRLLGREPGRGRRLRERTGELALVRALEAGHGRAAAEAHGRGRRARGDGERVVLPRLRGEEAFGGGAVPLALAVLFERVLDRDRLVHEVLPVHRLDRGVRRLEVCVGNEAVSF